MSHQIKIMSFLTKCYQILGEILSSVHWLRVEKEDEMSCLIKGCNFLLKNISDEAFTFHRHANPEYEFQLADPNIFPYMLVNIGSGVSILKVW